MTVVLSEAAEARLREIIASYPQAKSAVMPALFIAQEELGWVSDEAIEWVAQRTGAAPAHVRSVASFYTMYYKRPVGKYHIQLCRTLSCAVCGGKELLSCLRERFGVAPGEVTANGMWSFEEVECLGSCGTGPVAQINDVYFERLDAAKLEELIRRIEEEQPDLRYSTVKKELGGGLADRPRSAVWK